MPAASRPMPTETIYCRLPAHVKVQVSLFASQRGISLASAFAELVRRGLARDHEASLDRQERIRLLGMLERALGAGSGT